MKYHTFGDTVSKVYEAAILIKDSSFKHSEIQKHYVNPLTSVLPINSIIAYDLEYPHNKITLKLAKEYLAELLPVLNDLGVKYLYVADAMYFKALTNERKAEPNLGYKFKCTVEGFEHMTVCLGVNYGSLLHNPNNLSKLTLSTDTFKSLLKGDYEELGKHIFKDARYPKALPDIQDNLNHLHNFPMVSCDIETFGLDPFTCGIATIAFAWSQSEGVAFPVDYNTSKAVSVATRRMIREFIASYKGKLMFHNAGFDVKVMIVQLWMNHPLDRHGMYDGLEVFDGKFEDTMAVAYVATNNATDNVLGLKPLSHAYAGNYGMDDINDVTKIAIDDLLQYNLVDALCTWYVNDTYRPIMVIDQQSNFYYDMLIPTIQLLLRTEIVGMPMNPERIGQVKEELAELSQDAYNAIQSHPEVIRVMQQIRVEELAKINSKLKVKQHGMEKVNDMEFNPGSVPQMQKLLYESINLPILDFTKSKQPATGVKVLAKLAEITSGSIQTLLNDLIEYSGVEKILSTFIPAFEKGTLKKDDWQYLHGSFTFGVKSGRLSSRNPKQHWALRK